MKEFNKISPCVKCGSTEALAKWIPRYEDKFGIEIEIERINRTCRVCDYEWSELPIEERGVS